MYGVQVIDFSFQFIVLFLKVLNLLVLLLVIGTEEGNNRGIQGVREVGQLFKYLVGLLSPGLRFFEVEIRVCTNLVDFLQELSRD